MRFAFAIRAARKCWDVPGEVAVGDNTVGIEYPNNAVLIICLDPCA